MIYVRETKIEKFLKPLPKFFPKLKSLEANRSSIVQLMENKIIEITHLQFAVTLKMKIRRNGINSVYGIFFERRNKYSKLRDLF